MKKKLVSLVLAIVMLLGCMTVTAFALDDLAIILDKTTVTMTVGTTQEIDAKLYMGYPANPQDITSTANFTWTSLNESVATVDKGTVTALKAGTTTITVTNAGLSATCTVTVISGSDALDLDTNNGKDIEQKYTFTQKSGTETTYTDVTKVKVEWTLTDIAASFTSEKTWNPGTMSWDENKTVTADDCTASFTFTNYSSKKVAAEVSFKPEDSLKSTLSSATFKNGETDVTGKTITLETPVTQDNNTYKEEDFTAKAQTITAALTFNKDSFADLTATASATKYGTYTVTIIKTLAAKQDQTIEAPTAAAANIHATTITLNALDAGYGDTLYGYSTTNDINDVTWDTSCDFTGLTKNTPYYFFAKYAGDETHNEAVSEGTLITTKKVFTISVSLTEPDAAVADANNPTEVEEGTSATLKFTCDTDNGAYFAANQSRYNGAQFVQDSGQYTYEYVNGVLTINIINADKNVTLLIGASY